MKKCEEFIVRKIADDYVMMPIGETAQKFNGLIMANAVSAFIWENIEKIQGAEDLANMLIEEFEVSYEEALEDSKAMLDNMLKAKWIEIE